MVERRDAEENVAAVLSVVVLFCKTGLNKRLMVVQNCLWKTCCAGGEVYCGIVLFAECNRRCGGGAVTCQFKAVLCVGRYISAHKEQCFNCRDIIRNCINTADKFRAENQHLNICKVKTVFDFISRVAVVHRNCHTAGLEDAKVYRQPFKTVHNQHGNLCAFFYASAEQKVGNAVCAVVKILPAYFAAVRCVRVGTFDKVKVPPGNSLVPFFRRVNLHQCGFVTVQSGVSFKQICDNHKFSSV